MKKLFTLLVVCMFCMVAFAQTDSSNEATGQVTEGQMQESPSNDLTLTPASANLGNQPIGHTTLAPFSLTNSGSDLITIMSIAVSNPASYSIDNSDNANSCFVDLGRLYPGTSCGVLVAFNASGPGPQSGTLTIHYEEAGNPRVITTTLSANGVYEVTLSTALLPPHHITCNYYLDGVGCIVTLINQQPTELTIDSISVSPNGSEGFQKSSDCPLRPNTLAAFGSCTISLTCNECNLFVPLITGTLTVTTDAPDGSPAPLNIQGCRIYGC